MSVRMFYFENLKILLGCKRSVLIVIYEWSNKKRAVKCLLNFVSYFLCPATAVVERNPIMTEEVVLRKLFGWQAGLLG